QGQTVRGRRLHLPDGRHLHRRVRADQRQLDGGDEPDQERKLELPRYLQERVPFGVFVPVRRSGERLGVLQHRGSGGELHRDVLRDRRQGKLTAGRADQVIVTPWLSRK